MPIEVEVDGARHLTVYRITGPIKVRHLRKVLQRQYLGGPTLHSLWDLRQGSMNKVTSADLAEIIEMIKPAAKGRLGGKTALVALNGVNFGLGRAAMSHGETKGLPFTIKLFRDISQAMAWIME